MDDWKVDVERLSRRRPDLASLVNLEFLAGTRAFGTFPSYDIVPPEMQAKLRPADEAVLRELKTGRYDAGLRAISAKTFQEDVANLSTNAGDGSTVRLKHDGVPGFEHYEEPSAPPLAKMARLTGRVEMEFRANAESGAVAEVTILSGNSLLAEAVQDAAKKWRVSPGSDARKRPVHLSFEFHFECP